MKYGLKEDELDQIIQIFAANPKVNKVVLFGSRAKGNFQLGSDIDLALFGSELVLSDLLLLYNELEKLELLNTFDLVIYERIKEPALIEHIDRIGKEIYSTKLAA